jgi:diacylglycerol kinase (ATP)
MKNQDKTFSWRKRARSFKFAIEGIATLLRSEHNAWIHSAAALLAIILGALLHISAMEWCVVIICIASVLSAEAVNTAVEALADKLSPEPHPLIKRAKDVAAGAVLLVAIAALIIGIIIFLPKLLHLLW